MSSQDQRFERRYSRIKAAYESGGHIQLSKTDQVFLRRVRCKARANNYPSERIQRLTSIGFSLEPQEESFKKMQEEVKAIVAAKDAGSSISCSKQMVSFCKNVRHLTRNGQYSEEHRASLQEIGFDFEPMQKKSKPTNILPHWKNVAHLLAENANEDDLKWLNENILSQYSRRFLDVANYKSIAELVLKAIKVGDISPSECTRQAPTTNIRHTLSYICSPSIFINELMQPTWKSSTNRTVYFGPEQTSKDRVL
jgi:hypothetical protein